VVGSEQASGGSSLVVQTGATNHLVRCVSLVNSELACRSGCSIRDSEFSNFYVSPRLLAFVVWNCVFNACRSGLFFIRQLLCWQPFSAR
jgi:hypothetical protein